MPKKTFTAEQIVSELRQIEVLMGQGKTVSQAANEDGISRSVGSVSRRDPDVHIEVRYRAVPAQLQVGLRYLLD